MHRWVIWLCMVAGIAWAWAPCAAVDLREVGLQVVVSHHPLLVDGQVQLRASAGICGKFAITEGWMLRVSAGSLLRPRVPYASLATLHALGERWGAEAELSAEWIGTMARVSLIGGARWALGAPGASRVMLSSFPVGLALLHGSSG